MDEATKKSEIAKHEEEVLSFWKEHKIFEKSFEQNKQGDEFVFYDGPPFATGLPHYGHLLQSAIKDIIPRYQTMKGRHVRRQWGWDVHGLPIENIIEKELGLKSKKDIEEYGVKEFNEAARKAVLRYADDWKQIIPRFGRWVDMEDPYNTMDPNYTETVWWIFKTLYDKKLIYEDYKSMHVCPRCETTLANFEVNQGYKEVKDISVTVKFESVTEPGTHFLAWTTTPWTLPGNVALAVNPDIQYVKVHIEDDALHGIYIVAKERLAALVERSHIQNYTVQEEVSGKDLIGHTYKPPFRNFYDKKDLPQKENGWKVYGARFVTTEDGTGIVHIAPAFGEDDLLLRTKHKLPFAQHVTKGGIITDEVPELAGKYAKPKDNPQETDIEVIKLLAQKELLFAKQTISHQYPHCWRCDTPLLNYAASSWFVAVTDVRKKLVANNKKIKWVPAHIKDGRFGKWLEGARDWAISRSRFWGAPLPVWKSEDEKDIFVPGSLQELQKYTKRNNYFILRHGEADSNAQGIVSAQPDNPHHLTEKGKAQVQNAARELASKKIDFIFSSDFVRTRETAELVADALGIKRDSIIYDKRIREINTGDFNLKPIEEYRNYFSSQFEKFHKKPPGGETVHDVKVRTGEFLYDIDKKYKDKNILIISHEYVLWMIESVAQGLTDEAACVLKEGRDDYIKNAEERGVFFAQLPHNDAYELDFHKPYIDDIEIEKNSNILKRIPDVFDCWFESGSMPYGQHHYPFENKNIFDPKRFFGLVPKGFPADFIGESLEQTRGWFYSMLVLSTTLFNTPAYKNVVATGLILAEDGQKMSKRLKNYPDPIYLINTYGADSLRYYLISSPVVRGEDLNLSEQGVAEIMRKIVGRFLNVYKFFELYKDAGGNKNPLESPSVLDQWILSRLSQTITEVERELDSYQLDRAARPVDTFIEDLSVWYVRRSRDRFTEEKTEDAQYAHATLLYVIKETAKFMAPFMPFVAEHIYQKVRRDDEHASVHLCMWPKSVFVRTEVLEHMALVRDIVEEALAIRSENKIKVRQPLSKITITEEALAYGEYSEILKGELNVKEVVYGASQKERVALDTEITPVLREEGLSREIIRNIQSLRKKENLTPGENVELLVKGNKAAEEIIKKYTDAIQTKTNLSRITYSDDLGGDEIQDGDLTYVLKLKL